MKRSKWLTGWQVIALALFAEAMYIVGGYRNQYPVITEHEVAVYRELPSGDWEMSSRESGRFAYRPCDDEDKKAATETLREGIGYIADHAVWQERGSCRSLNGPGLNFYWTNGDDQFRRISDARATDSLDEIPKR